MQIEIPAHFFETNYAGEMIPGKAVGLSQGANCQHFAFEVLRHFGFQIGDLRSSDLMEDVEYTDLVGEARIFDLLLFNRTQESYGAHVGICLGENKVLHLSKKIGKPVVWDLAEFLKVEEYRELVGIKRPKKGTAYF